MRVARRSVSKFVSFAVASALVAAVCTTTNDAPAAAQVTPTGKGIAGGALLGGEIGFLGLAAFNAKSSWLYYTIPPLLAVGGGVGGYFIEQGSKDNPDVPLFMLAGGMALVIPTVVITLSATTYRPGNEDSTPSDASPSTDGKATVEVTKPTAGGGGSVTGSGSPSTPGPTGGGTTTTTPPAPPKHKLEKPGKTSLGLPPARSFALLSMDESSIRVGVPAVTMKPAYTNSELAKFGLVQRYEVHAPLVDIAF
jgi:hypothetical protein